MTREKKKKTSAPKPGTVDLEQPALDRTRDRTTSNHELAQEIADRKRAEAALQQVNRALRTLSRCNAALIHAENEQHLLDTICSIIVTEGGYRLAWVAYAEYDEARTVRPAHQCGYEEGYLDTLKLTWADTERGRGPTGTAIRTGRPSIIQDILSDPRYEPWRADALQRGYRSSIALPLELDADIRGALNIYAAEPYAFQQEEATFLTELAGNVAFGIMALRTRTARQRAEDALKEALHSAEEEKNRSAAVIAAIGDGISIQNTEYRVLYQNEVHRKLVGDHVGEFCYQAYERRDAVCEGCPVALSFQDGRIHTVERSAPTDQGLIHVEITASPLRDPSGTIIAGIEIARDITARKRSERSSAEQARHALLGSDVGVALTRGDNIRPMLQSCAEAQVKHLDAFLARIWTLNEGTNTLELQASAGAYTHLNGAHGSIPLEHYDYKIGWIAKNRKPHLTNMVIGDPMISDQEWVRREQIVAFAGHPLVVEGRLVGVMGMFFRHELSEATMQALSSIANEIALGIEHKRAETERENLIRELKVLVDNVSNSHREWRDTFDNIQDPIYITDADYTIKRANQAFIEFVGKPFSEVIDRKCHDLLHGTGEPYRHGPHQSLQETGMPVDIEMTDPVRKRTLVVSHFPYALADGRFGGSVSLIRDVTDDREKEMRLIMAERLGSLGQMAAGIAHEINNPLASILGCAEALHMRVKKGKFDAVLFDKYLTIVQEEVARCKNITTNMLSVSRSAAAERGTIDINVTLQRTIELVGYQGRLKDVQVGMEFASGLPLLQGNEGELRQVFLAVLINALDAMNDSGMLTIGTHQEGNALIITIGDTGPGIPPELVNRVFDPFYTTKSGQGGTGLGLAIARKIVADYKGDITLSSGQGKGTTVAITLPLEQ